MGALSWSDVDLFEPCVFVHDREEGISKILDTSRSFDYDRMLAEGWPELIPADGEQPSCSFRRGWTILESAAKLSEAIPVLGRALATDRMMVAYRPPAASRSFVQSWDLLTFTTRTQLLGSLNVDPLRRVLILYYYNPQIGEQNHGRRD